MTIRRLRLFSILALSLAMSLALGCGHFGGGRTARDALVPGASSPASLTSYQWRGDYLDVGVAAGGHDFRFLFPASPGCKAQLEAGDVVGFVAEAPLGRVVGANGATCSAVGVLSLRAWIDHGPEPVDEEPIAPNAVRFAVTDQDADLFLAVGDFPLAAAVGWSDPQDAILVMPNRGTGCRLMNVFGSGTMEFHPGADEPIVVVRDGQRCAALGFTRRYRRDLPRDEAQADG